jgi:hypothetical protein
MAKFPADFTNRGSVLSADKVLIADNAGACKFSTVEELMQVLSSITIGTPTFSGVTTIETLILDGTQIVATAEEINILDGVTVTAAEINYLTDVTSNIQDQLDAKLEAADISGLATTASVALKANLTDPEFEGAVAIGGGFTPGEEYAILDLNSTTKALLVPRMTTTQRNVINPSAGMIIFNTILDQFEGVTSTGWHRFQMYG